MTPYQYIKEKIILGEFKPNSTIDEKELAKTLNTSRTPIREAILKLKEEGYITIFPRKGTLVSTISFEDIKNLYQYRMILDSGIASIASQMMKDEEIDSFINEIKTIISNKDINSSLSLDDDDKKFHMAIANSTSNPYLINEEEKVMNQCLRIRFLSNKESKERYFSSLNEHIEILEAIKSRSKEEASNKMKEHLKNALKGYSFLD